MMYLKLDYTVSCLLGSSLCPFILTNYLPFMLYFQKLLDKIEDGEFKLIHLN